MSDENVADRFSIATNINIACDIATHDCAAATAFMEKEITSDSSVSVHVAAFHIMTDADDGEFFCDFHIVGDGESSAREIDDTAGVSPVDGIGKGAEELRGTGCGDYGYLLRLNSDGCQEGNE